MIYESRNKVGFFICKNADQMKGVIQMEENREVKREKVRSIPIEQIEDFPEHPFKIQDDEQMQKLIESIQNYGVITPVVARKIGEERYELISGHRRKYACKMLGIDRLPVIVRDMSRDEAVITMVDSNLQREHILPRATPWAMTHIAI